VTPFAIICVLFHALSDGYYENVERATITATAPFEMGIKLQQVWVT
jgi:hypothetical protein